MAASIPVVNFPNLSSHEERQKLRESCEKYGCFRLINHPISETLMAEMKSVAKHLHDLPTETKKKNKSIIADSGYLITDATNPIYEGLGIYDMHARPQAVDDFCSELNVSPQHRQILEAYGKAVHDLSSSVAQKIAESLGVENTDFEDWPFIFRIVRYKFSPEALSSVGLKLHTDTGFITLLQDDDTVGGFEMIDESNSYKEVTPTPGSFLCLIGDVGHAWSNGRFQNVRHRVMCKATNSRYSFGAFMLGPRDRCVEAPEELVDSNHKRLYKPFKYEDMRKYTVDSKKITGQFLDQFRIDDQ